MSQFALEFRQVKRSVDISIIVPSFQQGKFLRECLDSILSQKGIEVEVLLFDSESTDETSEILREYRSRIYYRIEKDLGQAHAINKGLNICNGKIIGYLNSDDVLESGALKYVLECWKSDPDIDLLYGKARYIDSSSSIIGDYRTKPWNWRDFQGECFICQPAAFWSRKAFERVGLFNRRLVCSVDYEYWIRIAGGGGKIRYADKYLAYSRDYPSTKTRRLRSTVLIENIKISMNRIGMAHPFWFCQYLDYFKYELRTRWSFVIPPHGAKRDLITNLMSLASKAMSRDVEIRDSPQAVVI